MRTLVQDLSAIPKEKRAAFLQRGLSLAVTDVKKYERTRVAGSGIDMPAMQKWVEDKLEQNRALKNVYKHITNIS